MSPFVRARIPELEHNYDLSSREMLGFIDGLNESFMANPFLQATNTLGSLVGMVPMQTTQIIGGSLSVAAGLGAAGVSMVRTKMYMKRANETVFNPRGLHAQICKTEKMLAQLGLEGEKDVFEQNADQSVTSPALSDEPSSHVISKRMDALGSRVMPLSFHMVEAPVSPENWAKRFGSWSAQRAEKKQLEKLGEKRAEEEEEKQKFDEEVEKIKQNMQEIEEKVDRLDPNHRRYKRRLRDLNRDRRELQRDLEKAEREWQSGQKKHAAKIQKRGKKEANMVNKIYWILITPKEGNSLGDDDWASEGSSEREVEINKKLH